jgi:hypothetical protein
MKNTNSLQKAVLKLTRVHFAYVLLYMLSIVTFDTWNLIPHDGIVWRWQAAALLLVLNAIAWYLARSTFKNYHVYKFVAFAVIIADAIFAAYNIYWTRGMSSPYTALFAMPLVVAAILHSRRAIWASAFVSVAAYSTAVVKYFHLHYGEGLKVELYGTLLVFCGLFFILAWLLTIIIQPFPSPKK